MKLWQEVIGWLGAVAILSAYGAVSFEIISPEGLPFQLLNISGALGLTLVAWKRGMTQGVFLNSVWIIIGLFALWNILFP